MKVGDYVRTKDGRISKIASIDSNSLYSLEDYNYKYKQDWLVKSSPNIIDLIEVGDYVNGSRVEEIEEYNGEKYLYLEEMEYSNANQDYINVYCKQEYIKSIVTKEAFESMEYRIGE